MTIIDVYWTNWVNHLVIKCNCGQIIDHPCNYAQVFCVRCHRKQIWHEWKNNSKPMPIKFKK